MIKVPRHSSNILVGVISDTHGALDPKVKELFHNVQHVIHAGDVVSQDALIALEKMAPLTAVQGNMDSDGSPSQLPRTAAITLNGVSIYILHDITHLDLDPKAAEFDVVVHGHTHRAQIEWRNDILYLNPGSAGFPRGAARPSIALLKIAGRGLLTPEIIYL
jgi:hypothetical protein